MKFFFKFNNSIKKKSNLVLNNKNNLTFLNDLYNNNTLDLKNYFNQFVSINSNYFFINIFFSFFNYLYNYLKNNYNSKNFFFFFEINSALKNNNYLYNPIFFLSWYLNYFTFLFQIKNKINFKLKKKNIDSQQNTFTLKFLNKNKRKLYFFKMLKSIMFLNKNKKFNLIFNETLMDTFLNFKNSSIYKNKILIYKKFLSN